MVRYRGDRPIQRLARQLVAIVIVATGTITACNPAAERTPESETARSRTGSEVAGPSGADSATPTLSIDPSGIEFIPATANEILAIIRDSEARAILVNVWATWCVPCREEFPDLMRVHSELHDQGLQVILISADFDTQTEAAKAFLAEQGVDFPTYWKVGKDMEFIDTIDPRWSGTLPATWVFDAEGNARHFWENKASFDTIQSRVLDVLDH